MDTLTRLLDAIEMMHRSGESSGIPEASCAWKDAGYPRPTTPDVAPPGTVRIEVPIAVFADETWAIPNMLSDATDYALPRALTAIRRGPANVAAHVVIGVILAPLPPPAVVVVGRVQS